MDRRANKKLEAYMLEFKNNIHDKSVKLGINHDNINKLFQYIYDYERLSFGKDDFTKRKRVKNTLPLFDRCCAKRANNEQCTRRKKDDSIYCGTHLKGTPLGDIDFEEIIIHEPVVIEEPVIVPEIVPEIVTENIQKIEVWGQDIYGIIYYLDNTGNIYQAEDIIINKINPTIIGTYTNIEEIYSIQLY
jgi:hypothetical protein